MDLILKNAALRGKLGLWDIAIEGGKIVRVEQNLPDAAPTVLDAGGNLAFPGFVNPHLHVDKSLLGERMAKERLYTFRDALEATWDFKRHYTVEDLKERADRVLKEAILAGTTMMRMFADVDSFARLKAVEGLLAVKQAYRGVIDLEVVAFPQEGLIRDPGTYELLDEALKMGADVVGGLPWFEMTDADGREHIDQVFRLANKYSRPIHMLVDDTDDPYSRTLEYLAVKTLRDGFKGLVTASHCGALAAYDNTYAAKIIELVAAAGISICSNPHISLVFSGRRDSMPVRRGITRVKELLAAGVNVCAGQDDVNDPYYPLGRADQLEVAAYVVHGCHMTNPTELETAFDMVSSNAAKAMGLTGYGIAPGCQADVVVMGAPTVQECLRLQPERRFVIKGGRLIAETRRESLLHWRG